RTRELNEAIRNCDYEKAMRMRGEGFQEAYRISRSLVGTVPPEPKPGDNPLRLLILHGGGPSPGMNAAVRAVVRMAVENGYQPVGALRGFRGLINNDLRDLDWMGVTGWAHMGGSELGTSRK